MPPTPRVNVDERTIEYSTFDIVAIIQAIIDALMGQGTGESLWSTLVNIWEIYSVIALVLSLIFFLGFIYARIRYGQLAEIHMNQLLDEEKAWEHTYGGVVAENSRWQDIKNHIASESPNDWRIGIIEADVLLEETLIENGYSGASIGEMLKSANPGSFTTLQDAWEAHKIRNQIAHAGGDFVLTKKIAQETVVRYERVFREFGAI